MARLRTVGPRLQSLPAKVPAAPEQANYGKGRGGRPWRRMVEAVKLRDQYRCQMCGRLTDQGECDHIIPEAEGGQTVMSNLQWLCKTPCHEEKTKAEAARGIQRTYGGAGRA